MLIQGYNLNLYQHQSDAINFAIKNNGCCAIFHDPGLGKTITSLTIFKHYRQIYPNLKLLVICPLSLINAAWKNDIEKSTNFSFSDYKNIKNDLTDIIAVNYETFISVKHFNKIVSLIQKNMFMCVLDESSRIKNYTSKTTKLLLSIVTLFKFRIILSGTPAPNSELEYWGQMNFVKPFCLENSFFHFRNKYFHLGRGQQQFQGQHLDRKTLQTMLMRGWDYQITNSKREQLMNRIKPFAHWVKKEDALDLPEKIDEYREVELSKNERKIYNEMKRELITEINGKEIIAQVALAKILKLREATSGFMYDETGKTHKIGNSKLNELAALVDELGNQQVIIFVQFREEIHQISELLTSKSKSLTTLFSQTDDRDASITDFQQGKVQYLIANTQSSAHGLTFINCSTIIYFSYNFSYELYIQSRDRIHRLNQKNNCLYIHLVAKNTIDQHILNVLQKKQNMQNIIQDILKS